eukprot:COSAG01_NODE_302_length_19206_cov_11.098687_8_plen_83_part_00
MQLYRPEPSHLKSKKYKVWVLRDGKPKLIHFGSRAHMHFRDKLGHYSALDHEHAPAGAVFFHGLVTRSRLSSNRLGFSKIRV